MTLSASESLFFQASRGRQDRKLTELLDQHDAQRFERLVLDSLQRLEASVASAASLTLSFQHHSGRKIETQALPRAILALVTSGTANIYI